MCFLRSVLWLAVLPQSRHCHTLPLTFLVSEATWSSMAARKKQEVLRLLLYLAMALTIRLEKLGELLALVEGSQMPLKGSFSLELDRSLTIKARIGISINVNALNMPEKVLLPIVVYQTHCTLPVLNPIVLFTNYFLLQEFSHPVLIHKHWKEKSFNSCVQSWRDVEELFSS